MLKDTLYTVNRWNKPLFEHGFGRSSTENRVAKVFWPGGDTEESADDWYWLLSGEKYDFSSPTVPNPPKDNTIYNPALNLDTSGLEASIKNTNGSEKGSGSKGLKDIPTTRMGLGMLADVGNKLAYKGLSNGLSSKEGAAISEIGNTIGGAVSMLPGVGKFAGPAIQVGAGVLGGAYNALNGTSIDQKKLSAANAGTAAYNNYATGVGSMGEISEAVSQQNVEDAYRGGVLKKGWAKNMNNLVRQNRRDAISLSERATDNNISNIEADRKGDFLAHEVAFGGPIEHYDYLSRRLLSSKRPVRKGVDGKKMYAIGGDMQTNSADFSTGLMHIGAGGSHEENPDGGVQLGVDREGVPNLVEEGEVVFNDYVYSNRILMDDKAKKRFHFPKKKDMSYADAARRLEKEIKETPNDPISKAGFKLQMMQLREEQERQKEEMASQEAQAAFASLSPEEQVAVMQGLQQQEVQQAQAMQAQQQEALAAQQMQQGAAQEMPPQEGMPEGMPPEGVPSDYAQMQAYGGRLYSTGGVLKLLKKMGYKTIADAEKAGWKPSDFGDYSSWDAINSDSKLSDKFVWTDEMTKRLAVTPEMKALFSLGWNPTKELLNSRWYEGDAGNDVGWSQSYGIKELDRKTFEDYAKRYKNTIGWAVKNGLLKAPEEGKTISTKSIMEAMRQSPAWKNTDQWLYSDIANQAAYLGMARGLNPDDDTKFINRWSPYGSFSQGDDGRWVYTLRDNLTDKEKEAFTNLFKGARSDANIGVMYNNFSDPDDVSDRYVIDDEGNLTRLISDDLSGYVQVGNPTTWGDDAKDINRTVTFYKVKTPGDTGTDEGNDADSKPRRGVVPVYDKNEALSYAGLFKPAVGLTMQALGIGKPDTSELDAASRIGSPVLANAKYIGDYKEYNPEDFTFDDNALRSSQASVNRAFGNLFAPVATKEAGMLANTANHLAARADALHKGRMYNDSNLMQSKEFNRGTNQFNAQVFNQLGQFNASQINNAQRALASQRMSAAQQKMAADREWNAGIYRNIGSAFDAFGALGQEAKQRNMVASMAGAGLFGTINPDNFNPNRMLRWETDDEYQDRIRRNNGIG